MFSWSIMASISNGVMDAIDHHKGERKLKYVWHGVKLIFYFFAFMTGVSFVLEIPASLHFTEPFMFVFLAFQTYWYWIILWIFGLWVIWELVYRCLRKLFNKKDIPDWF